MRKNFIKCHAIEKPFNTNKLLKAILPDLIRVLKGFLLGWTLYSIVILFADRLSILVQTFTYNFVESNVISLATQPLDFIESTKFVLWIYIMICYSKILFVNTAFDFLI